MSQNKWNNDTIAEARKSPVLAAWLLSQANATIASLEKQLATWKEVKSSLEKIDGAAAAPDLPDLPDLPADLPPDEEEATPEEATPEEDKKEEEKKEEEKDKVVDLPDELPRSAVDIPRAGSRPKPKSRQKRSIKRMNTSIDATNIVTAPSAEEMKKMEKDRRTQELDDLKSGKKVFEPEKKAPNRGGRPMGVPMGAMGPPGGLFGGGNPLDALKKKKSLKKNQSEAKSPAPAKKAELQVTTGTDPLAALRLRKKK